MSLTESNAITPAEQEFGQNLPDKGGSSGAQTTPQKEAGRTTNQVFANLVKRLHDNPVFFRLVVSAFKFFQRSGLSIVPNHFYWPVPDVNDLQRIEWPNSLDLPGIDLRLARQLNFARNVAPLYSSEYAVFSSPATSADYHYHNGYFEAVDAEVAYCMVRSAKPSRIIEVGGGFSTRVLCAALKKNATESGSTVRLTTIDPFPKRGLQAQVAGDIEVIEKRVQEVDLSLFSSLGHNDILFLDSSHVVATGGDTVREYLEIIPRLRPGVIVHAHDIFLPSDYPRESVVNKMTFWSEQYLLQAFLAMNSQFEVLWGSSAMQALYPEVLAAVFPQWNNSYVRLTTSSRYFVPSKDGHRVWPSSFWMQRVS